MVILLLSFIFITTREANYPDTYLNDTSEGYESEGKSPEIGKVHRIPKEL